MGDPVGDALLARIYEDPEDEDARAVYIDHLLERGDPRGEYLLLAERLATKPSHGEAQAQRGLDHLEHARLVELAAIDEERWLGPVAHVTARATRTHYRGFLDTCELALDSRADLEAAIGAPQWATVTRLERSGKSRAEDLARVVLRTPMPLLRVLGPLDEPSTTLLAADATERPIEELSFYVLPTRKEIFSKELVSALSVARGLPRLRHLHVGFVRRRDALYALPEVVLEWLFESPLAARLEIVSVAMAQHAIAGWIERLEGANAPFTELRLLPESALGSPSSLASAPGDHLALKRAADGRFSTLAVRYVSGRGAVARILEVLRALPAGALVRADLGASGMSSRLAPILEALSEQRDLREIVISRMDGWITDAARTQLDRLSARGVRIAEVG